MLNKLHTWETVYFLGGQKSRVAFADLALSDPDVIILVSIECGCGIKQIDNIFPCVCTVIDHRRRHSV